MQVLWHAVLLAHQPHDNTYGLAATPDGQTVFVDSRHCVYRSQVCGRSVPRRRPAGAGLPLVAGGALMTHYELTENFVCRVSNDGVPATKN